MTLDFGAASLAWDAYKQVRDLTGGAKLTQQTAGGIVPTLDDEAILLAVDQAVSQLTTEGPLKVDGKLVMRKITALRSKRLKPHQNDRWRKIITTLKLTEHFEQFATSVVEKNPPSGAEVPKEGEMVNVPFSNADGRRQNQQRQGQQQKKPGLHEIIRSYQRMPKDYEYTWEDPRVGHLVMVAGLIEGDDPQYDPRKGIDNFEAAYEYLLSNCFDEKSAIEKTKKLYEAIASGAYDVLISLGLENDFSTVEKNVAEDDPDLIAKLNAGYETALDQAISRKRSEIRSHRDGIQVWDGWKDKNGEDLVRIKRKWIPTYFSPSTWVFIITVAVIFLFAATNSKG